MNTRFSISLIPYLVRYRLSSLISLSQGNLAQLKQYLPFRSPQVLIRHEKRVLGLFFSTCQHP